MAAPLKIFSVESLTVRLYRSAVDLAEDAAREVQTYLQQVIAAQGSARAILATGNSQLQFLDELIRLGGVDWSKITFFHMDEYLGISGDHTASFRRYMRERVEQKIKPKQFHYLEGDALEPINECERYAQLLQEKPIDLCCLGIGENGHLAFNDPPVANFKDPHLVKIVKLDDTCKMQQVKQGHFPNLETVPPYALTLTIPALCAAKKMVGLCPGKNKAQPLRDALKGPVSPACPASILRRQPQAVLLVDTESSSLLGSINGTDN
jgi:glucosamine-6-phosphate deaminase